MLPNRSGTKPDYLASLLPFPRWPGCKLGPLRGTVTVVEATFEYESSLYPVRDTSITYTIEYKDCMSPLFGKYNLLVFFNYYSAIYFIALGRGTSA